MIDDQRRPPRVALFQPVLAHYRVELFEELQRRLGGGLTLFSATSRTPSGVEDAGEGSRLRRLPAPTHRLGPLWFVPRTLREVWSRRWDVVVLSWNVRQVELVPTLLLARRRGVAVVLWGHGLGRHVTGPVRSLRRWQALRADAVLTYSEAGRRDVAALAPGQRVRVMQNTSARPVPDAGDELADVGRRIAYLGRLDPRKRVDRLLDALTRPGLGDVTLDVLGDGPERSRLEAQAARLGLGGRVRWHGQRTLWTEVAAVLAGCDLVIQPDAAGLAVVDAFAAARGVVVLDDEEGANGPEAELVVEGQTGYRYWPPSADALASCLLGAYDHPSRVQAISAACGECYRERLTAVTAAEAFSGVVHEVAGGPARR